MARRRLATKLETLEPRVLLSADAFGALDLGQVDDGGAFDDIAILDTTDVPSIPADAAQTAGDVAGIELNLDGGGDEPQAPINVVGEITLDLGLEQRSDRRRADGLPVVRGCAGRGL